MSYYFGHPKNLSQIKGFKELSFSFPNGYTAKVFRNIAYPGGDDWGVTLMHKDHVVEDTPVSFNGIYLAKGKSTFDLNSEEIEAYLDAVKMLPMRFH